MTFEPTAGFLGQSGLTSRDLLIGALLSIEDAAQFLDRGFSQDRVEQYHRLLVELCAALDPVQVLPRIGYGVPDWLVGHANPPSQSGLGAFLDRLVGKDDGWAALFACLADDLTYEDLTTLFEKLKLPVKIPDEPMRRLRNESVISLEGTLVESSLAAATVSKRSRGYLEEVARNAYQSADPLKIELGARLRRMDFAIVARHHANAGMILGADVNLDSQKSGVELTIPGIWLVAKTLGASGWAPADQSFLRGLERGRAAALDLLRTIGAEEEVINKAQGVSVQIRGVLPPTVLTDQSAGLPLALTILSKVSDLAMPPVVASGSFDAAHRLEQMLPLDVDAKVEGVRDDGLNEALLVHAPEAAPRDGLHLIPENTLAAACRALWDHDWDTWATNASVKAMRRYGYLEGWRNGARYGALVIDGQPVVVQTNQSEVLSRLFYESQLPQVAFLGGPAQSGKTWIAQDVEQRLLARSRQVLVLRPATDEMFPTAETLIPTVRMLMDRGRLSLPLLVILDDLEWSEDARDLEDHLFELSNTLHVSVLGVIRSDDSSDWETEHALTQPAVIGEVMINDFAAKLVATHPRLKNASGALGTVLRGAGGNLWWLVRLLDIAANTPFVSTYGELLAEYYATTFGGVSAPERRDVARLAALSYVGLAAPPWFLKIAPDDLLRRLGAHRNKSGDWRLSSRAACESLLALSEGRMATEIDSNSIRQIVSSFMVPYIKTAIQEDRREELIGSFEKLKRHDPDILSQLLRLSGEEFETWALSFESPSALARLFNASQEDISDKTRRLFATYLIRLLTGRVSSVTAGQLAACLNLLRQHRFLVEQFDLENGLWQELLAAVEVGIPHILRSPSSARARTSLTRALWRLHDAQAHRALLLGGNSLLKSNGTISAADYRLALEFTEINEKSLAAPVDLAKMTSVVELAEHEVPVTDGLLTYVSRLLLRLQLDLETDWEDLLRRVQNGLRRTLASSSALELSKTLQLLSDFNRAFAVKLFTRSSLSVTIIKLIRSASAGEAATLIATLGRIHGQTARDVLYDRDLPRMAVAKEIASRIQAEGDSKGAGRLLKATLNVDANFGTIHEGFAYTLATLLGPRFFEAQFIVDPRTSVLFHLLNGMIAAGVGFSDAIRGRAVDGIVRNIESNYREWAPRLALLLIEHTEYGDWFASELAARVRQNRLLEGMSRSRNIEALTAFHELCAVLRPDLAAQFVDLRQDKIFAALYRADRPEIVTRAARAVSQTIRRTGESSPGQVILGKLQMDWRRQLATASTCGDLAESVRNLTALDQDTARSAVTASQHMLRGRIQRGLQQQLQSGIELLDAIEQAAPGLGRQIVQELSHSPGAWNAVMEDIAYEQDPRSQGTALHMLAQLGGLPRAQVQKRIFDQWLSRIHNLSTPAGLVPLLRTFAAWDTDWVQAAVKAINIQRISARMTAGASTDLQWAEALVGALSCAGATGMASSLIESLKQIKQLPRRMGLKQTARLLIYLRQYDSRFGAQLLKEAISLAQEQVQCSFVLDDVSLLLNVGWVARTAHVYGINMAIDAMPFSFSLPHAPEVALWGAGWLAENPWQSEEVSRAFRTVNTGVPPQTPWAAAAVLTVASARLEIPAILVEPAAWDHVLEATPYHLEALLFASVDDAALDGFLRPHLPAIRDIVSAAHLRLHPARLRIEELLRRIDQASRRRSQSAK